MSEGSVKRSAALTVTETGVCVAILAVCSWITVPYFNVPFTMQTFAVFFTLRFLGGKRGTLAIAAYILLGLVGAPVFAGFRGGLSVILSYTGGYIVGFLLTGLLWMLTERLRRGRRALDWAVMAAGLAVCYLFGTLWFMLYTHTFNAAGFAAALSVCVAPFALFDALKLWLAMALSGRLRAVFGKKEV